MIYVLKIKVGTYHICIKTTNQGNWIRENKKYRFEIKMHVGEDVTLLNKTAKVGDFQGISEGSRLLSNEIENFLLRNELLVAKDTKLFHV